jgi:hypothetical protein
MVLVPFGGLPSTVATGTWTTKAARPVGAVKNGYEVLGVPYDPALRLTHG